MDTSPRVCPRCQQANFPIAEFCRHCGEPLHDMGTLSHGSILGRTTGFVIEGMFWVVDEIVRWWEIGRLTMQLKSLRNKRAEFIKQAGKQSQSGEMELSAEDRETLVRLSDEISRLTGREDVLRKRSWALTPELLLVGLILLFVGGIVWLRPASRAALLDPDPIPALTGRVSRVTTIPLSGFSVIRAAIYYQGSLFVGGDGGLVAFDAAHGVATHVPGLAPTFFVRDLTIDGKSLLVAGYGGVFRFAAGEARSLYSRERLPVDLINRIAVTQKEEHLLGTIGHGLIRGNNDVGVIVLGTQGMAIRDFAWMDQELWLLHDRGLLLGDGANFSPQPLQVTAGRDLRCLAIEKNAIFLGTDQGVAAGYRNARNWVWTILAPGEPCGINHLIAVDGVLLIGADEGLFRFTEGRMEKLDDEPVSRIAVGPSTLAAVHPGRVTIYALQPLGTPSPSGVTPVLPTIGSFVIQPGRSDIRPIPVVLPGPNPGLAPLSRPAVPSPGLSASSSPGLPVDTQRGLPGN